MIEAGVRNLVEELQAIRAESDRLFGVLNDEALYERPIRERHRVLFYIGHLDGFDSIQICREHLGLKSPDPDLDLLFQAGIDPDSSHLPADTPADWPSIEQVRAYATRCRKHVDASLERATDEVVALAVEHRQMHLETLAYMFHNFEFDQKRAGIAPQLEDRTDHKPKNEWRDIPAGEAILGKSYDGSFGWDNEYDLVSRAVSTFRVQRYKVTNGEYLRFVREGAKLPHFWNRRGDSIFYRGMFQEIPLPLSWPVYVSLEEAKAYADWRGKDLLTEEQFHRAAFGSPNQEIRRYPWGQEAPSWEHGNFDSKRWDPEPVDATPRGASAFRVEQLVGNGWEWTKSVFGALPGFKPLPSYPGYSANFFDGAHFVIKGGSPRTAARLLRSSFRNWFRGDYPYVYATFRCVEN